MVSRLTSLARRVKATGAARSARVRDRRRSVGKRVGAISALRARGRVARAAIDRLTAEIAGRARQTVWEAHAVMDRARGSRRRGARVLADQLERELQAAEQILSRTDLRLQGQRTIPNRRISLVDPDARPIRMGSPKRPPSSDPRRGSPTPPKAS